MREWLRKILGKGVASRPLELPGQARKVHILSAAERDAIVAAHLIRHLPALGLSPTGLPVLHQQRFEEDPKNLKGQGPACDGNHTSNGADCRVRLDGPMRSATSRHHSSGATWYRV
jgi:hypothetical protein